MVARAGRGSNATGSFYPFLDDPSVKLYGLEAAGRSMGIKKHAATLCAGSPGVLHGMFAYLLRDKDRQVSETNSISACLDYPRVGPEDAMLKDMNRAFYAPCTGDGAVDAFMTLPRLEGTIPSPESSRAIAHATKTDREMDRNGVIVATLSGRGDKDVTVVLDYLNSKKGRRHNAGK